jgi:hypothetical protein
MASLKSNGSLNGRNTQIIIIDMVGKVKYQTTHRPDLPAYQAVQHRKAANSHRLAHVEQGSQVGGNLVGWDARGPSHSTVSYRPYQTNQLRFLYSLAFSLYDGVLLHLGQTRCRERSVEKRSLSQKMVPNSLELCCPAKAGNPPLIHADNGGPGATPYGPARRLSISKLLRRITEK